MILTYNIKAMKVESRTKEGIFDRLRLHGMVFSKHGSYRGDSRSEFITVINFQKFRMKTKQTKKIVNGHSKTTSEIIRQPHWVGYYYRIPVAWFEITNSVVIQHDNRFEIKPHPKMK
jgi:hypothetical protein